MTVLKRAGLVLSGITDKIPFFDSMVEDLVPFHAGGKARAATTPEPRCFEFLHHLLRRKFLHALFPGLVPTDLDVGIDVPWGSIDLLHKACVSYRHHSVRSE